MSDIPLPPVPQYLREALKDYPELIQKVQERLNNALLKPFRGTEPLDEAIWAIEGTLDPAYVKANEDLEATEQTGDAQAIEKARQKMLVLLKARNKSRWIGDEALGNYLQDYKAALQ